MRIVRFIRRSTADTPGGIGPSRLAASIAMLAILPAALELPALAALGLATAVCCALVAWDVLHYSEHRTAVRQERRP